MRQCIKCNKVYQKKKEYFYIIEKNRISTQCKSCDNQRSKNRTKNLTDSYIKKCLRMPNASKEIIELKRLHIILKRQLKLWKST
jgi:hypothetical protein